MKTKTKRQVATEQWGALDTAYVSGWRGQHEDICRFTQPGRGRFITSDRNKGDRQDQAIINDTAVDSSNKLAAAMDTGITSPARVWARLTTSNAEAVEQGGLRGYLDEVQSEMFAVFARSNFYKVIRALYLDLIGPATSLMWIEEDDEDVVRFTHIPIGQYRLAVDKAGRVSRVFRQFSMSTAQLVEKFGLEKCSDKVKEAYKEDKLDDWHDVLHVCEKRRSRYMGALDKRNKKWASCWYQLDAADNEEGELREDGYDEQPFVAPRWDVIGEDAYGRGSPGWQCLGDAKALQSLERMNAKTLVKLSEPPFNVPDGMKNASALPNAMNVVPKEARGQKMEPAVTVHPSALTAGEEKAARHENRIRRGFLSDVIYFLTGDQRADRATAEEVRAQKDERLLLLGGAFARFADEALKPIVNRVLAIMQRAGIIQPPPPELFEGGEVVLEFQNVLVSAQKTIGITGVRQLVDMGAALAAAGRRDALEKLDADEVMDTTAEMLGTPTKLLLSDEKLAGVRQQRAAAEQAKAQGEALVAGAGAVRDLSQSNPENLRQMAETFGPAAAAAVSPA